MEEQVPHECDGPDENPAEADGDGQPEPQVGGVSRRGAEFSSWKSGTRATAPEPISFREAG